MKVAKVRTADRVESFVAAVDAYEPHSLRQHADAFRVFARFISRSIDGRYLDRHPASELLPDIEQLLASTLVREPEEIKVRLSLNEEGSGRRGVLVTCMLDQPFLYSTVRLGLEFLGVKSYRTLNSVIPIRRDATGEITAIGASDSQRESFIWLEIEADGLAEHLGEIEAYIRQRLEACRTAVSDFVPNRQVVSELAERFEQLARERPDHRVIYEDNARFLRWLLDDHFVFIGTRYLPGPRGKPSHLVGDFGVGKYHDSRGMQIEDAERAVLDAGGIPPFLWIRKSRTESWLYRPGRTDHVLVQCWDNHGRPAGIVVVEGLFNFQAMAEPRTEIPLLDRVIDQLYAQLQATKGTHRYRTIRNAFNSLPLEYLFGLQLEDVRQLVQEVLEVDVEHRLQIHITVDEQQNFAFVFVALPRSHYSDELRSELRRMLKQAFRASSVDDGVYAGDVDSVTVHFFLTGATSLDKPEEEKLREAIEQFASPWADRLYDELSRRHGVWRARQLHGLYSEAFGARYQEETSIGRAVTDIEIIETIDADNRFDCDLYREKVDQRLEVTRLRMYENHNIILSKIMPVLDNLGLVVIDQFPTNVQVPGRAAQVVATFRLSGVREMQVDLLSRRNRLAAAIRAIVAGALDNDSLNRLLLRADIGWNYVALIRAYLQYSRQIQFPYSAVTVEDVLLRHADIVRAITELFRVKFDPEIEGLAADEVCEKRTELIERSRRALLTLLEGVDDLTSDQVLRLFYELVEATVRTSFFARDAMKDHTIVLKLDPSKIARMPEPRPFREIYVHHPMVAGVHLRGGPIARGGIRWSDRLFDFRTEVLGLMATQNLKNVLIVPRGAKGGFVLRVAPAEFSEKRAMADEMYKLFIRGLLSVTDNLVEGRTVTPPRVLRYDDEDHYLVVAADKGTAHLSDTANAIATEHKFWLDDAFASGGSKGYDHKKEGITAKGAWECVKRHFREIGVDPEADPIRVAGVGDMSGDVFGNGMLRSKTMQLVAAFDHRSIFIDPEPDPEKSFLAREKMFALPRSSWGDYPREAMSKGGGIYPRGAKAIRLSAEAKELLGITGDTVSAPDLIKSILTMPVDLLWNGGIGTYVKAERETDLDVGDPANDAVRVNATEVRAKVIGEGGNLGITPAGRVELAQSGVRLNNDAVDNSAGVDMSDHEVNLKILFSLPIRRGALNSLGRDALMEEVKEEVSRQVLHNNWAQSRMISLDELRSRRDPARFWRTIAFLADRVPFNRRDAHLPGERVVKERMSRGEGLVRPELAVLAANAKLDFRQELMRAESFGLECMRDDLFAYFPKPLQKRFAKDILEHPLAINIARTILTNRVMDDAGATWLTELTLRTGRATNEIIDSYLTASRLLGADAIKQEITRIENSIDTAREYGIRLEIEDAIEEVSSWLLRHDNTVPKGFDAALTAALDALPECLDVRETELITAREHEHEADGFDGKLARRLAVMEQHVGEAVDVALLASTAGVDLLRAGATYVGLGESTGLLPLIRGSLEGTSAENLDRPARYAVRAQLRGQLVHLTAELLQRKQELASLSDDWQRRIDELKREILPLARDSRELCNLVMAADRVERQVGVHAGTGA